MKTLNMKQFLVVMLLALTATSAQARSWRINNDVTKNPDFTDINAAMASADVVAGDTLYLDPGCNLITEQTISKQVTIIGCGYFRADAPHTLASIIGITNITAPYTKMVGVIFGDYIRIKASQVIIERCKTKQIYLGSNGTTAQNVTIRQCYATRVEGDLNSLRTANCIIENCIIIDDGASCYYMNFVTIKNCYLRTKDYNLSAIKNYTLVNSILINAKTPNNNLVNCSSIDLEQNNIYSSTSGVTEAAVFTLEGADDQRYQLKDDSPAKGAAADGGDCGPYGGSTPYVAGGLPMGHPYYTKASIATRSENDKVKVSLQIKMQNE